MQPPAKKIYLIAGEASGDLHGSNLITALHQQHPNLQLRCWGGNKMETAGATLVKHYRSLAFMGFIEVVKNLPTIVKNLKFCKQDILQFAPDVLVLIDYPGFNLRIAKWAKKQGIKVVYYIAPQVWAWKENRVKSMKRCIDKMLCILPFEKPFFETKWQWPVTYVGHPLIQVIQAYQNNPEAQPQLQNKNVIALLPGSRQQEILVKLPIMLSVAPLYPNYQFVIAKAPGIDASFYDTLIGQLPNVSWVNNQTYALLHIAKAALVTSGTATLEAALFKVPTVICYKGSNISYQIAKRIITIKYIGLPNLIMDTPMLPELIQGQLNTKNLQNSLQQLLQPNPQLQTNFTKLFALLQQGGHASQTAAAQILTFL
jgi:lipid-A-disaccharide synthase